MLGRDGAQGDLDDPALGVPALYSLQCALTALWAGIGIRPNIVMGIGAGELAAAQAAGVFSLEDGLRIALAFGSMTAGGSDMSGLERVLSAVRFSPAMVTRVDGKTGALADTDAATQAAYWARKAQEWATVEAGASALTDLGVDVAIEIGVGRAADASETTRRSDGYGSSDGSERAVVVECRVAE